MKEVIIILLTAIIITTLLFIYCALNLSSKTDNNKEVVPSKEEN